VHLLETRVYRDNARRRASLSSRGKQKKDVLVVSKVYKVNWTPCAFNSALYLPMQFTHCILHGGRYLPYQLWLLTHCQAICISAPNFNTTVINKQHTLLNAHWKTPIDISKLPESRPISKRYTQHNLKVSALVRLAICPYSLVIILDLGKII